MSFLKAIDAHERQFEVVNHDIEDLKRQNAELQSLIRSLQQDIADLKDVRPKKKRMSIPRMIQDFQERRRSTGASSKAS